MQPIMWGQKKWNAWKDFTLNNLRFQSSLGCKGNLGTWPGLTISLCHKTRGLLMLYGPLPLPPLTKLIRDIPRSTRSPKSVTYQLLQQITSCPREILRNFSSALCTWTHDRLSFLYTLMKYVAGVPNRAERHRVAHETHAYQSSVFPYGM